jgi:hypothetical protein
MSEPQRIEISFATPLQIMTVGGTEAHPVSSRLTISYDGFTITTEGNHVMYTLPVDHLVKMKVSYVDAAGNPATVDGPVSWASSDDNILKVETDPGDSAICFVTPVGEVGQAQVTATADADLGDGVRTLITTCDIDVVAGEAVSGTIEPVGPPELIAPHPEPNPAA